MTTSRWLPPDYVEPPQVDPWECAYPECTALATDYADGRPSCAEHKERVMTQLVIHATGHPAPQGSKRHVGNGVMVESSKKVKPWRQDVAAAAVAAASEAEWKAPAGPLFVVLDFTLPRPRYHYRTGARANELRENAPVYVDKKPDADKLARSTLDALTSAGVIRDDAQIARLSVVKRYGDLGSGAHITISSLGGKP